MRTECQLDHIAVAAASLDEGVAFVARHLGVMPLPGGAHPRMGTHNHVLRLGDGIYLEVIAVDPNGFPPQRPRWFGLDNPEQIELLHSHGPRLATWVVRTTDIDAITARSPFALGPAERMSRGDLEWTITIPEDGSMPEGGTMPTIIQWPTDRPHPVTGMPDLGCRLIGLDVFHPEPGRLIRALDAIGLDRSGNRVTVRASTGGCHALSARIATPSGAIAVIGGVTDR